MLRYTASRCDPASFTYALSDPTHRFVSRGVNHVLSLSTSIRADSGDGTTNSPAERTGWGGDGSSDGTLRGFLRDAITQHFPKRLDREPGVDFRLPTSQEDDVALAFQLSLGRLNELDLASVRLSDPEAEDGRLAFMDRRRPRAAPHRASCLARWSRRRWPRAAATRRDARSGAAARPW
ncbi:hypothetical protein WMF45_46220 [Sorangium sp. So ce448]|uniref:hypothetical protein n=1 Tax=Sorangium sp. So ce448 TaxID=3133314 RepID=UPI003F61CDC2